MNDDHSPSPKQGLEPKPRPVWALLVAIAWFAVAGAMAILPHAIKPPAHPCDFDDPGIVCVISMSWGTPPGIAISLICGLLTLWIFWKPGAKTEATAAKQQATSLERSTLSPRVPGSDASSLSYGIRLLICAGIGGL